MTPRDPQFGAILFRASQLVGDQGVEAFDVLGIALDARWLSIVLALNARGPMTSTQLADHIGHSRQVIESRVKPGVARGIFTSRPDPDDARRTIYGIGDAARPTITRAVAVMGEFEAVYQALWDEIGIDLEAGLLAMEAALARRSLIQRLSDQRGVTLAAGTEESA